MPGTSGILGTVFRDPFTRRWLLISAALHLLAALFSAGFLHTDEHYQILEFLNYKLGRSAPSELPIEFHRQMRPWLQPAIDLAIVRILSPLGIDNPFTLATLFRTLAAAIGWLSLAVTAACLPGWVRDERTRRWSVVLLSLSWYLPALHARQSSESLAGSVFLIGLSLLLLAPGRLAVAAAAGALFGLAFEFRYQVGTMVAGAAFWLLFFRRPPFRELAALAAGLLAAIALGTCLDRWGYGQWVVAPWNYVEFNLIEGHVSDVDTSPPWDYFRRSSTETWPLLGLLYLVLFHLFWIRYPAHPLTWATLPLYLTHVVIGHKELRFLFPIAHAGPVLVALAIAGLPLPRWAARAFLAWNGLALAFSTLLPAWSPIRFYEEVYRRASNEPLTLHFVGEDPYSPLGIPLHFYRPKGLALARAGDWGELRERARASGGLWLFHGRFRLPEEAGELRASCSPAFRSIPGWIEKLDWTGFTGRVSNWSLWRCAPPP